MKNRILELQNQYPADYFRVESLGTTPAKREIYACHLGPENAPGQIVLTASIHGREYINTTVLLKMMEYYLRCYEQEYQTAWQHIRISFLPMLNPDGVCISMYTEAKSWKENRNGVDLNRNFPCGFGHAADYNTQNPGLHPADQTETKYLIQFVESLTHPLAIIHYHSRGNLIYYDYRVTGTLKKEIETLARTVKKTTGYRLVTDTKDTLPAGGFGDWCVYEKKIPSITVETGFLMTPVPRWQLKGICRRNLFILRDVLTSPV